MSLFEPDQKYYYVVVNHSGHSHSFGGFLIYDEAFKLLKSLLMDDILDGYIGDSYVILKDGEDKPVYFIFYSGIRERLSNLLND